MTKDELITILQAGARLHQREVMTANDYRTDRTTIEYLLTSALTRESLGPKRTCARGAAVQEGDECDDNIGVYR
jgi:hypothetical protein